MTGTRENSARTDTLLNSLFIIILVGIVFVVDLFTPLGIAGGVLYVIPVLLTLRSPKNPSSLLVASACSIFTLLGYFLSTAGSPTWMVLVNRFYAFMAIWSTALLIQRSQKNRTNWLQEKRNVTEKDIQYALLFEEAPDFLFQIRKSDLLLIRVNTRACEFYGYEREAFLKLQLTDLESSLTANSRIRELLQSAPLGEVIEFYREHKKKDGAVFPAHIRFFENDDNTLVASVRDLSELKQREEELKESRSVAEQANRHKSEFLSRMSHELRTPLNAILGFGQLLKEDQADVLSERQLERVDSILKGGNRLYRLVNKLLDLRKIESGEYQSKGREAESIIQNNSFNAFLSESLNEQKQSAVNKHKVLYIEDDPDNSNLLQNIFKESHFVDLVCAEDGRSGLELASSVSPDLILLDMNLPDIDGFEVFRRLKQDSNTCDTRVVALSSDAMPHQIEKAMEAGFDDYLTKPIIIKDFLHSIEELFKS